MEVTSVQYYHIQGQENAGLKITYADGQVWTCLVDNPGNRHYVEAMEWVAEGNTIQEAD